MLQGHFNYILKFIVAVAGGSDSNEDIQLVTFVFPHGP